MSNAAAEVPVFEIFFLRATRAPALAPEKSGGRQTYKLERELGISAGLIWGACAEATVVYTDRGISKGDTVAAYLYNCPEYLEVFFAALKIRAVPANVNYRYEAGELLALLENSDAEVLVYHRALADRDQLATVARESVAARAYWSWVAHLVRGQGEAARPLAAFWRARCPAISPMRHRNSPPTLMPPSKPASPRKTSPLFSRS